MRIFKNFSVATVFVLSFVLGLSGPIFTLALGPATVELGSAGNYVILSKTAVTTTGVTSVFGDVGISPAFSTDTTGFGLVLDSTGCFSKTDPLSMVSGKIYAADYNTGECTTPAILSTAVSNMEAAYTDVASRTPGTGATNLNVGDGTLSGLNFAPGTYTWNTPGTVTITGDITLTGTSTDVWIFQVSGTLNVDVGKKIILAGGAQASNVFWQVAGAVTLHSDSQFEGIILAQTNIAMQDGATLHGQALAQSAVTLDANALTIPTVVVPPPNGDSSNTGGTGVTPPEDEEEDTGGTITPPPNGDSSNTGGETPPQTTTPSPEESSRSSSSGSRRVVVATNPITNLIAPVLSPLPTMVVNPLPQNGGIVSSSALTTTPSPLFDVTAEPTQSINPSLFDVTAEPTQVTSDSNIPLFIFLFILLLALLWFLFFLRKKRKDKEVIENNIQ